MMLTASQISKTFPGVHALSGVDFSVAAGEVRALVGENGAGKSTLIKIIAGAYDADDGRIEFDGRVASWRSPHKAAEAGIHVIYQELVLFTEMTVAQNMYVGKQPRNRVGLVDRKAMAAGAAAILRRLGSRIDANARIKDLSVADKQMVEIARALSSNAKLLIFDEPTAVLGGREVDLLFSIIQRLKRQGVAIIFISHRLEEVFEIADSVTVLKDGKLIATRPIGELNQSKLVSMMIGRQLADIYPARRERVFDDRPVMSVLDIWLDKKIKGVSFDVHKGEIVGLAGMVGAGRTEIAHAIFGSLRIDNGSVRIGEKTYSKPTPRSSIAAGVGFLTEDRKSEGLFMLLDIAANVSAAAIDKIGGGLWFDRSAERRMAKEQIHKYGIAARGSDASVSTLSGGNQQKVLLGRWVPWSSRVLILDEPTRGVDVGAKIEIYRIIRELADAGLGVLMISSELPEIVGLCDRVVIICEGRKTGELLGDAITEEAVLALAIESDRTVGNRCAA
jgi:ribose transport system ATP-binding protein